MGLQFKWGRHCWEVIIGVSAKLIGKFGSFWLQMERCLGSKENLSEVTQSCLTLCDPMDSYLPGSSVHGIFQAWVLERVAISFSRGSSWPRDRTQISLIVGRCFTSGLSHQGRLVIFKPQERQQVIILKECQWDFPGGAVVKTSPSSAEGTGSIPGWGPKIPHAMCPPQNQKKKQYCNKFNKEFKKKIVHIQKTINVPKIQQ